MSVTLFGKIIDYIGLEFSCFLCLMFYHKEKLRSSQKKSSYNDIKKHIICFKIKNLPTLHSTSKIQPTASLTFVFSVSAVSEKNVVMKENCRPSFWP
jgi:hypothetical protein